MSGYIISVANLTLGHAPLSGEQQARYFLWTLGDPVFDAGGRRRIFLFSHWNRSFSRVRGSGWVGGRDADQ